MQMQDKQPQSQPQPRIATTHELMMPYAADLARMKAKGSSHGQMISWLHTQGAGFGALCLCDSVATPRKIPTKPN